MINTTSKRQHEIIETAGRLLMQKGIKGLTTKNLALELKFSESALYRHFKNKEDIIVLLLEYLANNIKERFNVIISAEINNNKKLSSIFESQFKYFSENPHFVVAILSEGLFDESEKINKSILTIVNYKMQLLTDIIENGKKELVFDKNIETAQIVHILMGSFRLMMLKWKISKFELELYTEGTKVMNTTLKLIQT